MVEKIVEVPFQSKELCCGCEACRNVCPKDAIVMEMDEFGFVYPHINQEKCVGCGLCKKICAYKDELTGNRALRTYVAVSKITDLKKSASGGIFYALATKIINEKGSVYGAACVVENGIIQVQHIRVDAVDELVKLVGSKYVQSSLGDIFQRVLQDLERNRKVLFSGTPCQCDALKKYLKKEYDNLIIVDIICHGVSNVKMLNDYLASLDLKQEVVDVQFRSKAKGWGKYVLAIKLNDETVFCLDSVDSSFYYMFLKSYIHRDNCYECKYASAERVGDITIGDFWGIEVEHPDIFVNEEIKVQDGVSCLIVNTQRGNVFIDENSDAIALFNSAFEKVAKHNVQLNNPCRLPWDRKKILSKYRRGGYYGIEQYFRKKRKLEHRKKRIKNFLLKVKG